MRSTNGDEEILTPADMGHKLIVALRSVTDPQALMQAIADRSTATLRSELNTKIEAMDKATSLWHEDLVRVPTEVQKAVQSLRDIIETVIENKSSELGGRIDVLNSLIKRLEDVSEQRFARIDMGLMERDKRADQLALANSAALAAALSAQKEAAEKDQKSAAVAIGKSELATSEAIKQGQTLFQNGLQSLTNQVNDLKSRLDKGEGSRTISDPATETRLAALNATVSSLARANDRGSGRQEAGSANMALILSIVAAVAAVGIVIVDWIAFASRGHS